ncbi:tandem-95 repeat protein, partial [bacterium]|nr:tandem-95 repeat protein [bacterium]
TIDFTSYVEDIDSSGLTIAISVGTEITADVTGMTIIFSATENWSGSETFTITVGDGQYEASDDVIVTVTPENDVPTIVLPDSFSFNEDESLVEDFTSYLNDIDGDDLILTATNSANIFAAVAGFSVTFTATENWSGSEELTFTINDQLGRAIASDTISINVISQDDGIEVTELLPAGFVQEIIELDTINFSITAADPDGNPLEYLWQLDGVDVSITPTYDFVTDYESEGNYNVTLNVTDNFTRNTLDYSWDVAVAKNNRTPSADDLTATVIEDEFVAITLSGSDPDEDVLTFSVVDPPAHGVFAGGTYTPDADYFGPDLFTYISNDGSLDSDPATVTITVTAVNDAPVINLSAASIVFTQNTTTTVDFASYVSDVDSGSLTLTAEGNLDITVSIDGLMVVFGTVDSEYTGSEVVTFTVTDGQYPASDATTITVNGLADTPATPTNLTLTLVGTDAIDLSWIDNSINEDGFRIYRGTASGSLTLLAEVAANNTSYSDTGLAPHTEYFYNVSAFNAFGESGMSDEQSESTPNTSPVIDLAGLNVVFAEDLGTAINIEPYINDDDGDELIITATSSANIFAVVDGFNVAFTATENWNGSEELTFTVNDQQGRAVASDVTTVVVDPVNDTPTIDLTSLSIEFAEDGNTTIDFTGYVEDIDSSGLTIAASVGTEITADVTGMTILFSATENWSGSETFTITVGDGQYEASDDVVVTVTPENDVPTIVLPDSFSFNEDESLVEDFTSYLNDIDGDDLILTATNSANIFAVVDGFNVAFTATENWNGSEELTFTVNDQQGRAIASDVTTVVVDPVNDAPTIDLTSLSVSFTQGTTIDVDFAEYVEDIDLDVLTLSALGNDNITVDINGLIATFGTANPEFTGFENIVFTVFDGEFEDQETTTVTVNALEGIPTPPSDLALTVNGTEEISLLWVDNSINEDGFRVYRGLAGDNFSLLAEVSANETSYTDNGLTQNTTYYYHVTSYNSFGESTPQEAQSATTEAELPIAPIVTAATSSSSEILLEWTDSIYEDGYKVYRSEVGGELGVLVAELPADQLEFLDDVTLVPGRTPDTEYWYIVEAFNIAGEVQSAQVSAMTLDIIPECPDNLLLEVLSDTEIAMTWTDNSDNELKFAIWRSQVEGDCGVLVAEVPVDVTFWQDSGLEMATDYWYCVYAYNEIGQCLTPASGGATTLNPVPTITSIEDVPSDEGGFVTVNFTRSIMDTGDGVGENYSIEIFTDESWTEVGNEQAVGDDTYSVIVLLPETGTISEPISFQFRVLAVMDEGGYFSEEMSGYAIDNLAPAVDLLTALSTQEGVVLEWSAAIVPDLQHFVVTRRELGGDMVEIGTSMTVSFLDA